MTAEDKTNQVKVNIALSVSPDERSQKLAGHIYKLFNIDGSKQAFEYIFRWYTTTKDEKKEILKSLSDGLSKIGEIAKSNKELFKKLKIPGTPTIFVNGYRFSRHYKVNDIEYFSDEIISLTMESKGQEASSHCQGQLPARPFP